jgi:hypothetical protein
VAGTKSARFLRHQGPGRGYRHASATIAPKIEQMRLSRQPGSGSHRERDDNYSGIVARLNDRWRIILCLDGLQWIVQRATRTDSPDGPRWEAVRYHRDRDAMLALGPALWGRADPEALATLAALPARIGKDAGTGARRAARLRLPTLDGEGGG